MEIAFQGHARCSQSNKIKHVKDLRRRAASVARAPPRLWPQHSTRVGSALLLSSSMTSPMWRLGHERSVTLANCRMKPAQMPNVVDW